jgi:uncharacterized protein YndB with AHSA1/START domain
VDVTADLDTPHPPDRVFALVEDLERYPEWLEIVAKVVAEEEGAWQVDLRGRLGPFARSKRLRMVRSRHEPPLAVRFERDQRDGRTHSAWVLDAAVAAHDGGSRLTMHLHYGGGLFGPVLEPLLRDEIERSRPRLLALLERDG